MHADPEAFAAEVARLCRPGRGRRLRRYLADLAELYRLQLATFIDRNLDSPLDLLGPELLHAGPPRRLPAGCPGTSTRYFADDRLRRLFSFQALYAGVSPFRAIAAYAVIAQLDIGAGRLAPGGRDRRRAPARWPPRPPTPGSSSATGRAVAELEVVGTRVTGVRLADGDRLPADAVVVTTDQPWRLVPGLRAPAPAGRTRRPAWPCTSGVRAELPGQAHHTISFGAAWEQVFDELTRDGRPDERPQPAGQHAVGHRPVAGPRGRAGAQRRGADPEPRPAQRRQPRPRLGDARPALPRRDARPSWRPAAGPASPTRSRSRSWPPRSTGPRRAWPPARRSRWRTPSARPARSGPRRSPAAARRTWCSPARRCSPGVGVPMVLISGRLAAERITGPVRVTPSTRRPRQPAAAARRRLPALRGDRRPARQELPPGHPAAHPRPPPGGARALRRRPHRRRPRRPARRRPGRRPRRLVARGARRAGRRLVRRPGPAGAGAHLPPLRHPASSTWSTSSPR